MGRLLDDNDMCECCHELKELIFKELGRYRQSPDRKQTPREKLLWKLDLILHEYADGTRGNKVSVTSGNSDKTYTTPWVIPVPPGFAKWVIHPSSQCPDRKPKFKHKKLFLILGIVLFAFLASFIPAVCLLR